MSGTRSDASDATEAVLEDVGALVDRVPDGWSIADVHGRRWGLTRSSRVDGRAVTVYAEELGGPGVVSANVYRTPSGDLLRPCEMPATEVLAFLREWRPVPSTVGELLSVECVQTRSGR